MCFPVNFSKLLRILVELPQREKCPDTELFLVRIFLYSDRSTFHTVYTTRKNLLSLLKTALSGLRQFLAIEIPLKMMKNAFYFTSKALFALKIFKFLSSLFGFGAKQLDQKDKVNLKFHDVTTWLINNCNTYIAQYLVKQMQSDNEIWLVSRIYHQKHFS